MTNEEKLVLLKTRYAVLSGKVKNTKCPGVLRKLARKIRNAEK